MSRLWRDQIQVFLAPERVNLVRFLRGFKPVQVAKVTALCKRAQGAPIWQSALQQLEKNLADAAGTELAITLSNHFVRYVTLPPQSEIATPEEVKSYATFRMREVYAEHVDTWILSISEWNPINGAICAAIPRDLMARLEQMATHYHCKLKDIEPYLASVYDHWHKQLSGTKIYFAVIESGRICIALLTNGIWHSIRNQRILHSVAHELLTALDQEAIFFGNKEAVELVHVFAPEHPELTLPSNCGWRIAPIPTQQIPVLAHYPSALANHSEMDQCPA
ncbi:hypothetical protein [Nitrosomonas sp. Nm166]|uniref:hypothetical protein n=1 Tax=Nitrosomonas sp. Nm166 TaxID=1881054 RepID=UPI0008E88D91|nr:hypothetical protein [Nitrosomonas sp. Nm166]SFE58859.1 hypothetical protein SAMN05428977_102139 [Nitrosomonas sp. Nm166]